MALAVNDRGQIVGTSRDYAPHFDPNVQEAGGVIFQKNGPSQLVTDNFSFVPEAINNKGQIAGNGTLGGQPHAFLLTPYRDGAGK